MTKLVSNDKKETVASAPTLQKALTLMTDVKEAQHVHPNHIMIPLDSDTKNVLGAQPPSFFCPVMLQSNVNTTFLCNGTPTSDTSRGDAEEIVWAFLTQGTVALL